MQTYHRDNQAKIIKQFETGFLVMTGYSKTQKTGDSASEFWQEANFLWLSGIDWPEWKLLIDFATGEKFLIEPELPLVQKQFEGYLRRTEATEISGVDNFLTETEAFEKIKNQRVYSIRPEPKAQIWCEPNPGLVKFWRKLKDQTSELIDIRQKIETWRATKSDFEIEQIKQVVDLTAEAYAEVFSRRAEFKTEADIQALFDYIFVKNRASQAYEPIVASGQNACTMHYSLNKSNILGPVLLDVGAKKGLFSSDVSRMLYVKKPTDRQIEIHQKLLQTQREIVDLIRPGLKLWDFYKQTDEMMKSLIAQLGLISDEKIDFRKFYPHAIGHGLGLDVHEGFGEWTEFQPGMIFTVEPGVYIDQEKIGFRIEDDILVTRDGNENLTAKISTNI